MKNEYCLYNGASSNSRVEVSNSGSDNGDENKERGNWTGKLDFLLSAIGFAVGLGNVWRFPYLAYSKGGGAFLIPYLVFLITAGLPLFMLEMSFGQFASQGPISVWRVSPFFKGIGYAMVIISAMVCVYYNMIIAWTFFYLFSSFTSELPWQDCGHEWNTPACQPRDRGNSTETPTGWNFPICANTTQANLTGILPNCTRVKSPSEEYWERYVLAIHTVDGIDDIGYPRWQLALCLLLAWIVIFLCLIKGIKSSGKVVYVTATFPYIVLVILLVRGVTLPGALDGILFYITPQWDRLLDAEVWGGAAVQIFYSLGVAFGGLLTMASYNKFHNNVYRDALIVSILNCATSIFAGFVVFSVIGFMANESGLPVDKVTADGPGLAFVAYPEAIAKMPIAPLWSILFFLMLFTLGLDSQFAMMETIISALVDEFPWLKTRKIPFTAVLCIILFACGLPCCCPGGMYVLNLLNWYSAGFSLMIVALLEIVGIIYVYGMNNFCRDIELMIGFQPNWYWKASWFFITPVMILGIIIFSFVQYTPVTYNGYVYPQWAELAGWMMVVLAVAFVPLLALIEYCKSVGFLTSMRTVLSPLPEWGPALDMHRELHEDYRSGPYTGRQLKDRIPMKDREANGNVNEGYQSDSAQF